MSGPAANAHPAPDLGAIARRLATDTVEPAQGLCLTRRQLFQGSGQSGQFVGSRAAEQYAGMTAGLVGGGSETPYDVGGQQMRAGLIQAGMPALGRFTQGTEAPHSTATSLMGAVGAMGGYSLAAEALTKMDPGLLTSIARGGEVPPWAASMGIGQRQAAGFLNYQRKAPLFEITDSLVTGDQANTLRAVRSKEAGGGSFMDLVTDIHQKPRETAKAFQRRRGDAAMSIATDLGGAMFASGLVASPAEGAGVFLGQMGQDKDLAPFLKGRGVGAASPQGAEAAALAREADLIKQHGIIVTKLEGIVKALPAATTMETQADRGVQAAASGTSGAPGSVGYAIAALDMFLRRIDAAAAKNQPQKVK